MNPITNTVRSFRFGNPGFADLPAAGDFDRIGRLEPTVFNVATATWTVYNPIANTTRSVQFGIPGLVDLPVPGDYTGETRGEFAVYRPSTGQWLILYPQGVLAIRPFGTPNLVDIPLTNPVNSALVALGRLPVKGASVVASARPARAAAEHAASPTSVSTIAKTTTSAVAVARASTTSMARKQANEAHSAWMLAMESLDAERD